MPTQAIDPGRWRLFEIHRQTVENRFRVGVAQDGLVDASDPLGVSAQGRFKRRAVRKSHQPSNPLKTFVGGWERVGLAMILHLEAVLDIAEESVGLEERGGLGLFEEFVRRELGQGLESLMGLQERISSAMEDLKGLSDEFDFADAAASEFDVAHRVRRPARLRAPRGLSFQPFHATSLR